MLVKELIEREQKSITFYADIYQRYTQPDANMEDMNFLIDKILPTITFPMIMTDGKDSLITPFESYSLNIHIDSTLTPAEQEKYMQGMLNKMAQNYPPLIITDSTGKVLQKFYYTHSTFVDWLQLFPIIEVVVVVMFMFIGYLAFANIKKNEESKVWIGMAKEAAHQLGTPISSLMAWLEIIRINRENPAALDETVTEVEKDLDRLDIIARRFSKIGSMPEMKTENLADTIENTCIYYEKRLPHIGKKIQVVRNLNPRVYAEINPELFAWVFENLLKNAAEAIESKNGTVQITLNSHSKKKAMIYIKDDGKGMSSKQKRQAFFPGFTTKKRGWGLGLSLCKRIIEEYHSGKIYIKDSTPGKGTTFVIELPLVT
jgi:nitrogen-specific signal transduction histidine kinase